MTKFKKFFLTAVLVPCLCLLAMFCVNISLDPDHIISKRGIYPFCAKGIRLYKIAGIINNYDVRNIIVGASLGGNFIASEVEQAMGWKNVFLLSKNAADASAIYMIASRALKKRPIENVIYLLQPERLADIPADRDPKRDGAKNGANLFDENQLNDYLVFAQTSVPYIKAYFDEQAQAKKLLSTFPGLSTEELLTASKDISENYMTDQFRDFNRPLFIGSLLNPDEPVAKVTKQKKDNLVENYTRYIKPLVVNNPDTHFHFVIPPALFATQRTEKFLVMHSLRYVVNELSSFQNVTVYSFLNEPFNSDFRLYKDLNHFHVEVARYVIQSVAEHSHIINKANVDVHLHDYEKTMNAYKVPNIWQAKYYPMRDGPYPKQGYITYADAAKLIAGENRKPFHRSRYLAEETYADADYATWPPLNASRETLESASLKNKGGSLLRE